ncbi:MAG: macro domain-containing protein [Synergistaceae bacterium]|jgi:O-acetyl-ADP-ribose deacetylase (regulator of RNase III)|nr:macro domain-containing protein [Synergistaceae bacterium]
MPFQIVQNDITKMNVDAIVNAANTRLLMGGGVCGAIFGAAGAEELQKECDAIGGCKTGQAVLTKGCRLPAKYIIHTPGPVWQGGEEGEPELLRGCYANSLALARSQGCTSIAFPLISSGIFGYPRDRALEVAVDAVKSFLAENDMNVFLVFFDKRFFCLPEDLLEPVESFIEEYYSDSRFLRTCSDLGRRMTKRFAKRPEEPFSKMLLRLMEASGKTDAAIRNGANIDQKRLTEIRRGESGAPDKKTLLALAVALELNKADTDDLLERAGHSLSHSDKQDVIVAYFIISGRYDIYTINETLFHFDQPLLGG